MAEVIAADQGAAATATAAPTATSVGMHGGYGHHAGYGHSSVMSADEFGAGQAEVGAGPYTMMIMLMTVTLGYFLLFMLMYMSCCKQRMAYAGFQRFDIEQEQSVQKTGPVSEMEPMWRKAFIGKVYTLLVIQIAITLVVSVLMMQLGGYNFYVWLYTDGYWTRTASLFGTLGVLVAMMCNKNKFPLNLILLFSFTMLMSYVIGTVTTTYAAMGLQVIVIEAFAITSLLFIGLTLFTMQSKIDFSFLGLILPILTFTLIIWGFFSMFAFSSFAFRQVYALAGVVIFSLYVLYDTHAITTYLSYDDYVLGAVNLYLDFINLLLFVMSCLAGQRRD